MIGFGPGDGRGPRPAWWRWYVAYCLVLASVHLLVGLVAALPLLLIVRAPRAGIDADSIGGFAVFGVAFVGIAGVFAVAPWLPPRRWSHILGMVLILWGWMIPPMILPGLRLIGLWSRPETLDYFGVSRPDPDTPN